MESTPIFQNRGRDLFVLLIIFLPLIASLRSDAQTQKIEQTAPSSYYTSWLNEDVVWIIKDQERAAFNLLQNDEERDRFIDAFWMRRNPHPDQLQNVFEDEHYRRISYANEHFQGAEISGWKSDRGRMYIKYGPPDKIESFPRGQLLHFRLTKIFMTRSQKNFGNTTIWMELAQM